MAKLFNSDIGIPTELQIPGVKHTAMGNDATAKAKINTNAIYETDSSGSTVLSNWYKAMPYGFKFTDREGQSFWFYLPISPNNISITTHFATNVISTLYGTVEEHSEQRYFDIIIDGNTGMAPQYVDMTSINSAKSAGGSITGRKSFSAVETISSNILGGLFSKTIAQVNQALNKAADILDAPKNNTGVNVSQTGYLAFHNLYKFLLLYKKDTSGELSNKRRSEHPLMFLNYKDNNQYYCSVQRFILRRSADNPMLYQYSIQLRAYKISSVAKGDDGEDMNARKAKLGLGGVKNSSILGDIKNISKNAKSVFGAANGGFKLFGS